MFNGHFLGVLLADVAEPATRALDSGPINRNFGISLSVWDWLFRTAYLPDHPPQRLGFEGIESFPTTVPGQVLHPLPA